MLKQLRNQQSMTQPAQDVEASVEAFVLPQKEAIVEHYEVLLLVLGNYSEEEVAAIHNEVKQYITEAEGTVTVENNMGRRNLAYKVAQQQVGTYIAIEFDLDRSRLAAVQERIRIRKDVERFMIVKKRQLTAEQQMEEQRRNERITARRKAQISSVESKDKPRKKRERTERPRRPMEVATPVAAAVAPTTDAVVAPTVQAEVPTATPTVEEKVTATEAAPITEAPATETAAPVATPAAPAPEANEKAENTIENIDKEIEKLLSDDLNV